MIAGIEIDRILVIILSSYLIGSIPTAYILGKLRGRDIFKVGSGNMGGTNVARSLGVGWGVATVALDMLKGIIAIVIARQFIMPDHPWTATTLSAISVIVGHNWSLIATFITYPLSHYGKVPIKVKGGKGAATAFGTLLMIANPAVILVMWLVGLVAVVLTRWVSLGVLLGFSVATIGLLLMIQVGELPQEFLLYLVALPLLLILRFRENIQRILKGNERRLGDTV